MVDNRGSSGGRSMGWLPWLLGALVVLGGLTAVDLAFYRDDIHDEAHEEDSGEEGIVEELEEPADEDH